MSLYCKYDSLITESDVEQKFLYPYLTSISPMGLSFSDSEVFTKQILRRRLIGKGKQKYYYPDYLITIRGIPVLVVEAKAPEVDLVDAYAEARLYAAEVNASYPHNISVCQKIIVSNATETWAGYHDQDIPQFKLSFSDFKAENVNFVELNKFCCKSELTKYANKPYIDAKGKAVFNTPVSLIGGKRSQDEELVENSYGRNLVLENRNIFDPETEQDKLDIVENAYIVSPKREQHMDPMYREIKKVRLPSEQNSTFIASENPTELLHKLSQRIDNKQDVYSLMLLIGNVGSGKTTFIRYFKKMYLEDKHKKISDQCEWVFINMNNAPVTNIEIYNWVKQHILDQI